MAVNVQMWKILYSHDYNCKKKKKKDLPFTPGFRKPKYDPGNSTDRNENDMSVCFMF